MEQIINSLDVGMPLVSVVVVTYNSSEVLIETLESIKSQSYKNIELIISDDASSDATIAICSRWLHENNSRFVNVEIVTSDVNCGIPANCNRGIKRTKGTWIKLIAGDDLLEPHCLTSLIDLANSEPSAKVIASNLQYFLKEGNTNKKLHIVHEDSHKNFFKGDSKQQFKTFLTDSFNIAPTVLFQKSLLIELDYFEEKYRYFEDLPMWLKITENGYKIHYVDQVLILYRTNHDSMNNNRTNFFNATFMQSYFEFKEDYIFKRVPKYNLVFYLSYFVEKLHYNILIHLFKNKRNKFTITFSKLFLLLDVKRYTNKIKKIFH